MAKKSVKSASTEVVEVTPAAPAAPTPAVEQPEAAANVTPTVVETVTDKYTVVLDRMQDFSNNLKEMVSIIKCLQKEHQKIVKQTTKKNKNAGTGAKRSPSGFAQPTLLSDQLCDFLGVAHGTSLARTEVTKQINEYIKKNKLQNPDDKRQILPDANLKNLLNMKDGDKLSYFNVQSYLKHQFVKTPVAAA